MRAVTVVTV